MKLEDRWVYINAQNEVVIDFARTSKNGVVARLPIRSARRFSEGLAAVFIEGAWGYINKSGQVIIEPEYLFPVNFKGNRAVVMKYDRTTTCIDNTGTPILTEYQFESISIMAMLQ